MRSAADRGEASNAPTLIKAIRTPKITAKRVSAKRPLDIKRLLVFVEDDTRNKAAVVVFSSVVRPHSHWCAGCIRDLSGFKFFPANI